MLLHNRLFSIFLIVFSIIGISATSKKSFASYDPDMGEPHLYFAIDDISYSGDGCPKGTLGIYESPEDANIIDILIPEFFVNADDQTFLDSKSCKIKMTLLLEAGARVSLAAFNVPIRVVTAGHGKIYLRETISMKGEELIKANIPLQSAADATKETDLLVGYEFPLQERRWFPATCEQAKEASRINVEVDFSLIARSGKMGGAAALLPAVLTEFLRFSERPCFYDYL